MDSSRTAARAFGNEDLAQDSFDFNTQTKGGRDQDMAQPGQQQYMGRGPQLPYEIAHNAYQQHMFSTGEPQGPHAYPYLTGRPDMGFFTEERPSVPYPQEPNKDRRRRDPPEYMQPPQIGFNPYKEAPQKKEYVPPPVNMPPRGLPLRNHPPPPRQRPYTSPSAYGHQPGWLMFCRYNKDGHADVKKALIMTEKYLKMDGAEILGIAPSYQVKIKEGGRSWVRLGQMRHTDAGWHPQQNPFEDKFSYNILVIRFPSLSRAKEWFVRDPIFKDKNFPNYGTFECVVLPEHEEFNGNRAGCKTIVLTEYTRIAHADYFRDYFAGPSKALLAEKFHSVPYIVKTSMAADDDDDRQRNGRTFRGSWLNQFSIVTVSLMPSLDWANNYFMDPEFSALQQCQNRVAEPTTIAFQLEHWRDGM